MGWRTRRKLVVFESDDWGSIRMPSTKTYQDCLKAGYRVDKNPYERNDALESETDLIALFEVLRSVRDASGRPACFTANTLVANPDFEQIRASGYQEYHFEPVTETFARYPAHRNGLQLWHQGQEERLFRIQLHGREHLNVSLLLSDLKANKPEARFSIDHGMLGCVSKESDKNRYVRALYYFDERDKQKKLNILLESTRLFRDLHGYSSRSFIAPNYTWSPDFNAALAASGVEYLQGNFVQLVPDKGGMRKLYHYLGQANAHGQRYLIRNCKFEPFSSKGDRSIGRCLQDMSNAFFWGKPAIISTHRVNYIGSIHPENRDNGLSQLSTLLQEMVKRWPDLEFISSDELGDAISGES